MKSRCAAVPAQSGAVLSTVLVALGGFVAGAVVMGMLALQDGPGATAQQAQSVPVTSGTVPEVVPEAAMFTPEKQWPPEAAPPHPWPYESATPGANGAPGARRPDRLSGPEGWTYDPVLGP